MFAGQSAVDHVLGSGQQVTKKDAGYSDVEWLVDTFTEADRRGKSDVFADAYATSQLKKDNDAQIDKLLSKKTELPDSVKKELGARSATVTPFWWGLKTLIKVGGLCASDDALQKKPSR